MTAVPPGLLKTLDNRLAEAPALVPGPHDLSEARLAGHIEAVASDAAGRVWLLGWSHAALAPDLPAVMLDGGRIAAALVTAQFTRADLPAGARGFIALLGGDWRPSGQARPLALMLGGSGQHLRAITEGLRTLDIRSLGMTIHAARASLSGPHAPALKTLLFAAETQLPGLVQPPDPQLELAIDTVVAIPGVGLMVEGWALAQARQITGFALQTSQGQVSPDLRCSWRMARPDLEAAMPRAAGLCGDAGFVQFFPLRDTATLESGLALVVQQAGRITTRHPLADRQIRWLSRGGGEEALMRCYPALPREPFFAAMASVIKHSQLAPRQRPVPWKTASCAQVLVLGISEDHDDPWRVMDLCPDWLDLARAGGAGLALIAPETARARLLPLFAEFEAATTARDGGTPPGDLALFFGSGPRLRPADLVLALDTLGAGRFALLRDGFRMDDDTAMACLDALGGLRDGAPPALLDLAGVAPDLARIEGPPGIVWTRGGLARLVQGGAAWGDLPRDTAPFGQAWPAHRPAAPRPMLALLQQAGIRL